MALHLVGLPWTELTKAWEAEAFTAAYNDDMECDCSLCRRFWVKVDRSAGSDSCWPWQGRLRFGYGHFGDASAHRVAYELLVGPIPNGLSLDHICHDPTECRVASECQHRRCVNPAHLAAVEEWENHRRGRSIRWGPSDGGAVAARQLAKTHCPKGHPYDEANTYVSLSRPNTRNRQCKTCHAITNNRARNARVKVNGPRPKGAVSQEGRAKLSVAAAARWADPAFRVKTIAAMRSARGLPA